MDGVCSRDNPNFTVKSMRDNNETGVFEKRTTRSDNVHTCLRVFVFHSVPKSSKCPEDFG